MEGLVTPSVHLITTVGLSPSRTQVRLSPSSLGSLGGRDVLEETLVLRVGLLVEESLIVKEQFLGEVGGVGVEGHHVANVEGQVGHGGALLVGGLEPSDPLHQQPCGQSAHHGEGHRDDHGCKLPAGLFGSGPAPLAPELLVALPLVSRRVPLAVSGENLMQAGVGGVGIRVEQVVGFMASEPGHEDRKEAAEYAGHPVEVVDAARVAYLPLLGEPGRDKLVAQGGDDARHGAGHD